MRKLIVGATIAMIICMFALPANADGTQELEITLNNNAAASILLNDTTWEPTAGIGEAQIVGDTHFELDNDGSVQVDVTVEGLINMSWTLESAAGHDQVLLIISPESASNITIDEVATGFIDDLGHDETQNFGFDLTMPTSTSTSAAAKITVTFTATAD